MKRYGKWLAFLLACALLCGSLLPGYAAGNEVEDTPIRDRAYANVSPASGYSSTANWEILRSAYQTLIFTSATEVDVSAANIKWDNAANQTYALDLLLYDPTTLRPDQQDDNQRIRFFNDKTTKYLTTVRRYATDSAENVRRRHACRDALTQLMYGVSDNAALSTYEKLLLLHDRLATWTEYDTTANNTSSIDAFSPYGALVLRKCVCEGYSLAYSWMMDLMGIENYIVECDLAGTSGSGSHQFNEVMLGGKGYFVDVTSDDPKGTVPGFVYHNYFLVSYSTYCDRKKNLFKDGGVSNTIYNCTRTDATSTTYESSTYFWNGNRNFNSQIFYIGGKWYYEDPATNYLTRRTSTTGTSKTSLLDLADAYKTSSYPGVSPARLTAIGNKIYYTQPNALWSFDVTTDTEKEEWKPGSAVLYRSNHLLFGAEQHNGTIRVCAAPAPTTSASELAMYNGCISKIQSKSFCTHTGAVAITNDAGQEKRLCPSCRAITDPPQPETLTSKTVKLQTASTTYDGGVKSATLIVQNAAGDTLVKGTDYTLTTPSGRTNAGDYTYKVTGIGDYNGTVSLKFTIKPQAITSAKVTLSAASAVYNGSVQKPTVTVKNSAGGTLTEGKDYALSWSPTTVKEVGPYTLTVTAGSNGNYSFSNVKKTYSITSAAATEALQATKVTLNKTSSVYNGKSQPPTITVKNAAGDKLTEGTHYKVDGPTSVKTVSSYTYKITGIGKYSGTVTKTYTITEQPLNAANITLYAQTVTANGKQRDPQITVLNEQGDPLTEGADYTVEIPAGRTLPGTYTYKFTGRGNYKGTASKVFTIKSASKESLKAENVTLYADTVTYNGSVRTPSVTVKNAAGKTLTKGTDYTVSVPAGRTNAGDYTYKITGCGKYTGTVSKTFRINPATLTAANVTLYSAVVIYNGKPRTPTVTVTRGTKTLVKGTDYTVTVPAGRTNAGVYTYVITGTGNYGGTVEKLFVIERQALHSENITLYAATVVYNGSVRTPTVTVKNAAGTTLKSGTDYILTIPTGRKNPGTYVYTIEGIGNYSWTIKKDFVIKPKS